MAAKTARGSLPIVRDPRFQELRELLALTFADEPLEFAVASGTSQAARHRSTSDVG